MKFIVLLFLINTSFAGQDIIIGQEQASIGTLNDFGMLSTKFPTLKKDQKRLILFVDQPIYDFSFGRWTPYSCRTEKGHLSNRTITHNDYDHPEAPFWGPRTLSTKIYTVKFNPAPTDVDNCNQLPDLSKYFVSYLSTTLRPRGFLIFYLPKDAVFQYRKYRLAGEKQLNQPNFRSPQTLYQSVCQFRWSEKKEDFDQVTQWGFIAQVTESRARQFATETCNWRANQFANRSCNTSDINCETKPSAF